MDDIGRKFRSFDWKGLQKQAKKVQATTASALKDLVMTDLENKVRAATGDTNWGASGADLAEIAQATYNREDFTLIMSILWQRLASTRWRCVYKALDVLKYVVMHGASRVLEETREALAHIRRLEHFSHVDSVTRRDEGANVRTRAANFVAMLTDEKLLEEERAKSIALRSKIGVAVPSSHYSNHGGGGGGGLSSEDYRFGAASSTRLNEANGNSNAGYDDVPRKFGTPSFNGYNVDTGSSTTSATFSNNVQPQPAYNASVDDLLGGFEAVPALPAPEHKPPAAIGLGELDAINGGTVAALPSTQSAPFGFADGDDDDDDDDFDPRGGSGPVFTSAPTPPAGPMSTSQLVANLAAARQSTIDSKTRSEEAATPLSAMQRAATEESKKSLKPTEDVAYGGLVHFENLMLDKSTRVDTKALGNNPAPSAAVKPVIVAAHTAVEKDPFGDLLSSAKKSGVF